MISRLTRQLLFAQQETTAMARKEVIWLLIMTMDITKTRLIITLLKLTQAPTRATRPMFPPIGQPTQITAHR